MLSASFSPNPLIAASQDRFRRYSPSFAIHYGQIISGKQNVSTGIFENSFPHRAGAREIITYARKKFLVHRIYTSQVMIVDNLWIESRKKGKQAIKKAK
jgi:hypothetical protein